MPRAVDHIAYVHALTADRRARGLDPWIYRLSVKDIFALRQDEKITFEEGRDRIVVRLRASLWVQARSADAADGCESELDLLIEELADATDPDEFDRCWDWLYDEADQDRCWIETF